MCKTTPVFSNVFHVIAPSPALVQRFLCICLLRLSRNYFQCSFHVSPIIVSTLFDEPLILCNLDAWIRIYKNQASITVQVFASILKCTELRDIICTKMNVLSKISKILWVLNLWLLCEVNPWILYACIGWFLVCQLSFSDLPTTTLWHYSGILDNTLREMHCLPTFY